MARVRDVVDRPDLKIAWMYASERVGDLAGKAGFESVTARLWNGATGKALTEADVRARLGAARERAFMRLPELMGATRGLSIVDGFRAAVAGLRAESGLDHEATIVGAFPVIAGALVQQARGNTAVKPDATLSHAADTLKMLLVSAPEARNAAALDAYFVTESGRVADIWPILPRGPLDLGLLAMLERGD